MLRRLPPLVAAACVADSAARRDPVTLPDNVRAAADAVDSARLAADVTYLASDALLGRSTPSPGLDSAAAYIVRRLTQSGLTPAGDGGAFLRHFVLPHAPRHPGAP